MIEKVARAIAKADEHYGGWPYEKRVGEKLASGYSGREILFEEAKAAIAAMREPTDEMLVAAMEETAIDLKAEWKAMIDAALAEGSK